MRGLVAVAVAALIGFPAGAAELEGRVRMLYRGKPNSRVAEVTDAVLSFVPSRHRRPSTPLPQPVVVGTHDKEFTPRVSVVTVGSTVRFPNRDPILHNVFSVSRPNDFDLGLYRQDPGKEVTFTSPGVVRVFCNVHHDMVAYVVVLDTPHYVRPDTTGGFRLGDLPPGPGKLVLWHERGEEVVAEVTVPHAGLLTLDLEITKPRIPRHLNKTGKPYTRGRNYHG